MDLTLGVNGCLKVDANNVIEELLKHFTTNEIACLHTVGNITLHLTKCR
jgi:hypothetical protein